ncbi:MAG TPA: efflux RND transporter periplasmic adaptor subunit [Verrucomicrobiae bacterium]|nr:efflux RND transporter periplasmic adaptor subunit [Verrucomicrobiae bacterium]
MKPKQVIIGILVVLCGGLGIFALTKWRGQVSNPDEETENITNVVSVQTGTLKRMTLHHYATGYGMVGAAPATAEQPAAGSQVAAPSAGVVARVNVVEGQEVKKGDLLAQLNSGAVTFDYAEQELARQRKLFAQQNTSQKALQDAEAQLAALQVVAPLSGTVTRLEVKPGEAVDVNAPVAEVVDLSRLAVSADIPVEQAADLKIGEELQVQTKTPVTAAVTFISPAVDVNNGTVRVRALLPADSGLRPGQFVPLRIVTGIHTNCLAVAEASVVTDESGHSTISLVSGDEATQTAVKTGFRENDWVEVEGKGLKAGDTVVTVGAYGLPEKVQIQVVNSSEDEMSTANPASSQAQ